MSGRCQGHVRRARSHNGHSAGGRSCWYQAKKKCSQCGAVVCGVHAQDECPECYRAGTWVDVEAQVAASA